MATATEPKAAESSAAPEAPKRGRTQWQHLYPSAEAAIKEAEGRVKGPRRAFKTVLSGVTRFIVSHNEGRAGGCAFMEAGGIVEEIGKRARAAKPLGVDGVMAALNSLPEEERKKVLEQLKAMTAHTKK